MIVRQEPRTAPSPVSTANTWSTAGPGKYRSATVPPEFRANTICWPS